MTRRRRGTALALLSLALLGCPGETEVEDPCDGIACSGRGYCMASNGSPTCGCMAGFHTVDRIRCEEDDEADPCRGVDCLGHGTCRVEDTRPVCLCDPGYEPFQNDRCDEVRCELLCVLGSADLDGGPEADVCEPAAPELCDERDNDCDGLADEDFDLDFDSMNCGTCGTRCTDADHAAGACLFGSCTVLCQPGWSDLDADPATGCEADCTPAPSPDESLCEGRDDDCDGLTDEDWAPLNSCGLGVCERQAVCYHGETRCRPRVPPSASDATCDGIDDDCDGLTDDECSTGADADADADGDADGDADADADAEADLFLDVEFGTETTDDASVTTPEADAEVESYVDADAEADISVTTPDADADAATDTDSDISVSGR